MTIEETRKKINQYFTEKLITFGATAKGVDYKSSYDQEIRFEQLLRVINPAQPFTLLDYGSGYGALYDTMSQKGWRFEYYGVDLIETIAISPRKKRRFPLPIIWSPVRFLITNWILQWKRGVNSQYRHFSA
jgi:hypothetical protein